MKNRILLFAILATLIIGGIGIKATFAQYTPPTFWKRVGTALLPAITGDTIGSSGSRISTIYTSNLDATSIVIGGAVTGNLTVGGSATIYGGVTAPTFVATSTLADSTFNRLTWVSATGTNTTSTNLFATNLSATNIVSALTPDANNTRNIGSGSLSWADVFASGTSRLANIVSTNSTSTYLAVTNVNSALTPLANNTYDIGSPTLSWKDVYASGTYHGGYFSASSTTPNSASYPTYTFEGDTDTGLSYLGANSFGMNAGGATKLYVNSSGNVLSTNHTPLSNGGSDLGAANNSWQNIYASGTIAIAGGSVSAPALKIGDTGAGYGIYAPVAGYSIGIATAGAQRFKCDAGDCTVNQDFYVAGIPSPNLNNTHNLGRANASWKNIYASGTILAGGGSAAVPSFSFGGDVDTGIYGGSNVFNITTGGAQRFKCDSGDCTVNQALYTVGGILPTATNAVDLGSPLTSWKNIYASGTILVGNGSAAAPAYSFGSDGDTGMYRAASDILDLSVGGTIALRLSTAGINPNIGFNNNILPSANNTYNIGSGSAAWKDIYASGTVLTGLGSAAAPSHSFGLYPNQGMFSVSNAALGFAAQGTVILNLQTGGVYTYAPFLPSVNNVHDFGAFGRSWKDIYASGTARLAALSTTGAVTIANLTAAGAGTTNPVCLDSSGVAYIGASQICPLSSLASKTNLRPISYGLDELLKTNFYDFELRQDDGRTHSGIVADYLKKTMPNLVMYEDGKVNGYDVFSMVGVLGQSIKDLNAKVESQQKKIDSLEARLLKLERKK